jgi:glycosyltransferase involved in cell wall biosynthesis
MRPPARLLFLLPFAPRLDGVGGSRAAALRIAEHAKRHPVAVLYLRERGGASIDGALRERCDLVGEVERPSGALSLVRRPAIVAGMLRGRPAWSAFTAVAEYAERLREVVREWGPDVVQIEFHVMGQYLPVLDGCRAPRVLTQHEPAFAAARDRWRSHAWPERAADYFEMRAWRRFERDVIASVDAVVVFTERDRRAVAELATSTPVERIPLGTPLPERPLSPFGHGRPDILFVGGFKHPPNVDAALRLAGEIFPQVRERLPSATLTIVGDGAPRRLARMAGDGIVLTGRVPDVGPYLDAAAVVAVPVRLGGGMRVKTLEAVVAGKATVASPLAVEGLDLVDGEEVVLAETDEQFVQAIAHLLADRDRRARIASNARAWGVKNAGLGRAASAYEALYADLLARTSTRDGARHG